MTQIPTPAKAKPKAKAKEKEKAKAKIRTRLSPQARHDQLLDTASCMVLDQGLQAFTMEGLAKLAGVSAPLVYNYFANRPALLQALLQREYRNFVDASNAAALEAKTFEDIVRISVTSNFDHQAPGNILPLLLSQPEIAHAIKDQEDKHRRRSARFLVDMAATQYQLDQRQAQLVIRMSSGASIAAADLTAQAGLDKDETIELAVRYILSGIERIAGAKK